jgi:hypothetical protein
MISSIFLANSLPFCFGRKVCVREQFNYVYKVTSVSKKSLVIKLENASSKFIIIYAGNKDEIVYVVKVPNSIESE